MGNTLLFLRGFFRFCRSRTLVALLVNRRDSVPIGVAGRYVRIVKGRAHNRLCGRDALPLDVAFAAIDDVARQIRLSVRLPVQIDRGARAVFAGRSYRCQPGWNRRREDVFRLDLDRRRERPRQLERLPVGLNLGQALGAIFVTFVGTAMTSSKRAGRRACIHEQRAFKGLRRRG